MTIFGNDNRMNTRHDHIITPNVDLISGKRVLDLGAYNGRWMWAALNAGAAHVTGVEGRPESAAKMMPNIAKSFPGRYDMKIGDVFDVLAALKPGQFDTIFCLGLFYHVLNHEWMLRLMRALEPRAIILDTGLVDTDEPIMRYRIEATNNEMNGISTSEKVVVGVISRGALKLIAGIHGYAVRYIDWKADAITDHREIGDYLNHHRFTCVLEPTV